MKKTLRIEYNKGRCIGNGSCAVISPEHFELLDKKATLLNSKKVGKDIYSIKVKCGKEESKGIIDAGIACPVNAIRVIDIKKGKELVSANVDESKAKEVIAMYDDAKEFVADGTKYFLIRLDRKNGNIEVGFCVVRNNIALKVIGKKPVEIYQTIINKEKTAISNDHAAYLGKELQKAYIALLNNLEYVQDEELDFGKNIVR